MKLKIFQRLILVNFIKDTTLTVNPMSISKEALSVINVKTVSANAPSPISALNNCTFSIFHITHVLHVLFLRLLNTTAK
jgi:hypothetical protein